MRVDIYTNTVPVVTPVLFNFFSTESQPALTTKICTGPLQVRGVPTFALLTIFADSEANVAANNLARYD